MGLSSFLFIYPNGKLSAIDAYFLGVSASTVTGLTTVDVPVLRTYQQLYLYFVPLVCNTVVINILVVIARLIWFRKYLKKAAPALISRRRAVDPDPKQDPEIGTELPVSEQPEHRPSIARAVTDRVPRNTAEKDALPQIDARSQTLPAPDQHSQRSVEDDTLTVKDDKVVEQEVNQQGTKITLTRQPIIILDAKTRTLLSISPDPGLVIKDYHLLN
jgi:hypothetical protein